MIGLLCFALAVLASPFKSKLRLEAENAVLRHQLNVLRRRLHGRVRLTNHDRWFLIQLYRWFPSILQVLTIIRPETLVRWRGAGFRCWVARQITEAFPWDEAPQHLIRDRDRIYGTMVTRRLRAMGIRDQPTAPASPWQNGFAERLIGSIRRECVDHIIVLGEMHLRRILKSYADYYNGVRTHRSLNKDAPVPRSVQRAGVISSRAVLGGLHHHDARVKVFGTHTPASAMIAMIIEKMTSHAGWSECSVCPLQTAGTPCPILENRKRLQDPSAGDVFRKRLTALVELSEQNGVHFPVRQSLALVTNVLLGHPDAADGLMSCGQVADLGSQERLHLASIDRNVFGENLSPRRAEKTDLFRKLNSFGIGSETSTFASALAESGRV